MSGPGRISELWRYPVKSLGGERVDRAAVGPTGLHADRLWAVRDIGADRIATARRIAPLLTCTARYAAEPGTDAGPGRAPEVIVTFPDGSERSSGDPDVDARLSDVAGRPVRLAPLPPAADKRAFRTRLPTRADWRRDLGLGDDEALPDASHYSLRQLATLARYVTPPGTYYDLYPLHVISRASLATMAAAAPGSDFDVRRFRPNVVVDGDDDGLPEFGWTGGTLRCGDAELAVAIPTVRCSIPTRAQPGLERDPQVMKTVAARTDRYLGVYAAVVRPGAVAVGDAVELRVPVPPGPVRRRLKSAKRRVLAAGEVLLPSGR